MTGRIGFDVRRNRHTPFIVSGKKMMMVVGACIFLIAAAKALPLFFGITA